MSKLNIEYIKTGELIPYVNNPRNNENAIDVVAGSIKEFGVKNPIIIDKDNVIIAGHTRLLASRKLGLEEVPVIRAEDLTEQQVKAFRIAGNVKLNLLSVQQDAHLSRNQSEKYRCGDNGIFKGVPLTDEEKTLAAVARDIYYNYPTDGKYILDNDKLIICQSNASNEELQRQYPEAFVNPLGEWTGGTDVDTGATNRKLGSDMAQSVTGGGLHGKDLSKADVSVNIYAFLKAQKTNKTIMFSCAIGDDTIDGVSYDEIVKIAESYIRSLGGFERFAEWGLF